MPDEDDRFGDVAEQLKQTEKRDDEENEGSDSEEVTATPPEPTEDVEQTTASTQNQREQEEEVDSDGPPFSFNETNMHGFYVRDETWNRITRMRSSVTAACSMFDVPDFEGREFQDACLQVVADYGDQVALQILRERGIEADEQRVQEVVEMLSAKSDQ
ncbi:hypothetical protein [Salinigranum salinum]|uniref:hypothetical protein n=1 Tax=Salinigranum salinum TaxID=1364937 RepID=UPI0012608EC2|nr:hypothetical protein [Salinigranum salinum]